MSVQVQADELVRAAMQRQGLEKRAELAKRLGLDPYSDWAKLIGRWLSGAHAPNFENTINLLELAGWLNVSRVEKDLLAAAQDEAAQAELRAAEAAAGRQTQGGRGNG